MKVFIDTNIVISAVLFDGKAERVLSALLEHGHSLCVSDYIADELKSKLSQKWPESADDAFQIFLSMPFIRYASQDIDTPANMPTVLRDPKDMPVLRDAIFHGADVILTGDKDLLEADIDVPMVFSLSMMGDLLSC